MPKANYYRKQAEAYNSDTNDVLELIDEASKAGEYSIEAHLTEVTKTQLVKLDFQVQQIKGDLCVISW
jgi:hypothetical protein